MREGDMEAKDRDVGATRQSLNDEDFLAGWANAILPAFQPLHGTIEQLRKRDVKVLLWPSKNQTSKTS